MRREAIFSVTVRNRRTFELFEMKLTGAGICSSYVPKKVIDGITKIFP